MQTYLGDGVYAEFVMGTITLTTRDWVMSTELNNTIILDPTVMDRLLQFHAEMTVGEKENKTP